MEFISPVDYCDAKISIIPNEILDLILNMAAQVSITTDSGKEGVMRGPFNYNGLDPATIVILRHVCKIWASIFSFRLETIRAENKRIPSFHSAVFLAIKKQNRCLEWMMKNYGKRPFWRHDCVNFALVVAKNFDQLDDNLKHMLNAIEVEKAKIEFGPKNSVAILFGRNIWDDVSSSMLWAVVEPACIFGSIRALKIAKKYWPTIPNDRMELAFISAAKSGHLKIIVWLKWQIQNGDWKSTYYWHAPWERCLAVMVMGATMNQRLNVLGYLKNLEPKSMDYSLSISIGMGLDRVIEWHAK